MGRRAAAGTAHERMLRATLRSIAALALGASSALSSEAERVRVLGVVSDVFLAGTLTSAGITAYLSLRAEPPAARGSATPRVEVAVGIDRIAVYGRV
jgi:hypothetical protein